MNLNPHRSWITPLVIGAFGLSAITAMLMFFHLEGGDRRKQIGTISQVLPAAATP